MLLRVDASLFLLISSSLFFRYWIKELREKENPYCMLLVGNKSDCVADLTAAVRCLVGFCFVAEHCGVCSALRAVSMQRQKG